jgi:hypothetical protein
MKKQRPKFIKVDENMVRRIHEMAKETWQAIGPDVIMSTGDEGTVLSRDEVHDCVVDHMGLYGNDKEAYEYWNKLPSWEQRSRLVLDAFPLGQYGM